MVAVLPSPQGPSETCNGIRRIRCRSTHSLEVPASPKSLQAMSPRVFRQMAGEASLALVEAMM